MSYSRDQFIEKFAKMLEDNELQSSEKFAQTTMDFIFMLSQHDELADTLGQIRATIQSILASERELMLTQASPLTANRYVAEQIRALKFKRH